MKASESRVVAEARKAAEGQMAFFNKMMAVKTTGASANKSTPAKATVAKKK
jgi:hypothetical protein